jgi:hypothetical protein
MTGRPIQQDPGQRGFVLIVAVSLITLLTLFGFTTLHTIWVDARLVYAQRQTQTAFNLAEAGMKWGLARLNTLDANFPDFDSVLVESALDCGAGTEECPCELTGWRPLSSDPDEHIIDYPDSENPIGSFRVVVKDDHDGDDGDLDSDTNRTILLRSYGLMVGGGRRMIEVTVTRSY